MSNTKAISPKNSGIEINTAKICQPGEVVLRTTAVTRIKRYYNQSTVESEKIVGRMIDRNILVYAKSVGSAPGIAAYTTEEAQTFIFVEKR